jgi:hypothetical protein
MKNSSFRRVAATVVASGVIAAAGAGVASADVQDLRVSIGSDVSVKVYSDHDGRGYSAVVPRGSHSPIKFVGSVQVPANYTLSINGRAVTRHAFTTVYNLPIAATAVVSLDR